MIFVKDNMNEQEAREFVRENDRRFLNKLHEVSRQIVKDDLTIIGLTGPTCSGKTTMANILTSHLSDNSKRTHIISLDDFFFEVDVLNRISDGEIDYDSPETIDTETLSECVESIFNYEKVTLPKFDFLTGKRTKGETICADSDDRFIFEGIQVLYPKVSELLKKYDAYKSIYIAPQSEIYAGGRLFLPNHIRLLRRLVRDYNFRGASADFSLYLWDSVRRNEEENIFPHIDRCDYFIDSTMGYDINMLAPYLRLILSLPHSGRGDISVREYEETASEIIEEISEIEPFSKDYLLDGSLYREFI